MELHDLHDALDMGRLRTDYLYSLRFSVSRLGGWISSIFLVVTLGSGSYDLGYDLRYVCTIYSLVSSLYATVCGFPGPARHKGSTSSPALEPHLFNGTIGVSSTTISHHQMPPSPRGSALPASPPYYTTFSMSPFSYCLQHNSPLTTATMKHEYASHC